MPPAQVDSLPTHGFFTSLARSYAVQTGNTTADLFYQTLPHIQRTSPITPTSVVHDNASGPGTATAVMLAVGDQCHFHPLTEQPRRVFVTDINATMVDAASSTFDTAKKEGKCECEVTYGVVDSSDLGSSLGSPDTDSLTHSILNFSIFALADPLATVREMRRTLRSPSLGSSFSASSPQGGLAVVTCWRRFGVASIIHRAQAIVRPDLPPMPVPREEFLQQGELYRVLVEAGFDKGRINVVREDLIVKGGETLAGLKSFMMGDFTKAAREGWTEDQAKRWPAAVSRAMQEEIGEYGGILFEAWIALAQK